MVMGILNLTPDSFYDGGKYDSDAKVLARATSIYQDGASILDIGAYSSRPGSSEVSEEEEWNRLKGVIPMLKKAFPDKMIAIDTFRPEIAHRSLKEGADMINDISGGINDKRMWEIVAEHKAPYIAMHMKGTPSTMQQLTDYRNLSMEVLDYLLKIIVQSQKIGLTDLILDPGFGFAKTLDQNYDLLHKMDVFKTLQLPILVGISRKSMIYKTLDVEAKDALNGSTALHMTALMNGADILRVHDVKEAVESITLHHKIRG